MKTLNTLAAIAALLSPIGAFAQEDDAPKKGKKAESQALTQAGPSLQYDQFRRGVELKVAEKRDSQIDGLKKLLETGPPEKDVPDIKFRLAELYFEKSRFYFFRANEAEEKANASKDPGQKDSYVSEQKGHAKEATAWDKRAVDIYKEIRERYPKYERMPEVLFALGQSLWTSGRFKDAIAVYTDLIRNFKDSPLVADAWLAFGEYYFNEKELNKALKSYELAAADKRSRVYGFALYKQGWCYYNLADWKKALEKFRATVFYSQMADTLSGENRISLGREAQKDFVKAYAFVGEPNRARFVLADLVNQDECKSPECLKLVEQLAGLWYDSGKFEESAALYRDLIRANPESTRNAYFQGRVVDLVSRSADKKATTQETRRLVEIYQQIKAKEGSASGEAGAKLKADIADAETLAEATVRRLGQEWNKEAKKTRLKPTYDFSKQMYSDYLRLFPQSKFAYEMRFQLADLYYKLEEYDQAAKAYEATVLADPKGKYLIDAANDNVLALEEHLKDLNLPKPKPKDEQPVEIHPERMRLIAAGDRYLSVVPEEKQEKAIAIMFKAGKIYYDHNQFEEAIKRFEQVVAKKPEAEEAEFATNLILDIYNLKKDWNKLYDLAARYLKIDGLLKDRDKLHEQLTKAGEYAKFKLVQILEEKLKKEGGNLLPVAKAYQEFQAEFPKSENADDALYNASIAYDQAGEADRAQEIRRKLMETYKDSPLRADVQFYIAKSYESRAEYGKAAELYEQFADAYPNDSRARDALYNAGVFNAGIGKVKDANALRAKYLSKYGKQKGGEAESAAIGFVMARDLERAERWSDAASAYADFSKKFPGDEQVYEALWREATLRRRMRDASKAEKVESTLFATVAERQKKGDKVPPVAQDYASRIAFNRLEGDFQKYVGLKIERPNLKNPAGFKRSLDDKVKGREQIIKAYTSVVTTYQQAWSTIGALYRIAQAWDVFVSSVLSTPCPSGLTEEQCSLFKQELQSQMEPARDSAITAYRGCVEKSNQLNVFTEFSTECVKALEKVSPESYPPMVERTIKYAPTEKKLEVRSNSLLFRHDAPGAGGGAAQASAQGGE